MLIPPYTITFEPSSSGTALVGRVIIPRPSGASGVHESPMVPVLKTYQSLGGPDRISSQKGITNSPQCHDSTSTRDSQHPSSPHNIPAIGNSREGCLGHTPPARLAPKTRCRILSDRLNPHHSPKMHAKISLVLLSGLPSSRHYVPYTYTPLTHRLHITNIMRVRVKAVFCNMRASSLTAGRAGVRLQQGKGLKVKHLPCNLSSYYCIKSKELAIIYLHA
jgi:hypothetical protein